jgi:hypothetical protein
MRKVVKMKGKKRPRQQEKAMFARLNNPGPARGDDKRRRSMGMDTLKTMRPIHESESALATRQRRWSKDAQKTSRRSYESEGPPAVQWRRYSVLIKDAAQIVFPYAAVQIEVGYIFLCSLDTIRTEYNASESDHPPDLVRALSLTIEEVSIQLIGYDAVSIIAEKSSEYLEQAQLFTTLTERLGLEESCSKDFRYFYETSLKSCLNQKFDEHADWLR